jgi:hypothetical protein
MGNRQRWGSVDRRDVKVRLATSVGVLIGAAVAIFVIKPLVEPLAELPFWLGLIAFAVTVGVGGILGKLVGRLLFRPPSGGPPDVKRD